MKEITEVQSGSKTRWRVTTAHAMRRLLHYIALPFRLLARLIYIGAAVLFLPFIFVYFAAATPKDQAYRDLHPFANRMCADGLANPWEVLARINENKAKDGGVDEEGWIDPSNSEVDAVKKDRIWEDRFRCSLQYHRIPFIENGIHVQERDLRYHLGFIEFRETGEPYSLGLEDGEPVPVDHMETLRDAYDKPRPVVTQLDALRKHLSSGSHYVIVFVHGWRHNASIGDQNVADLRHYAAHAARFLRERCADEERRQIKKDHCDMEVTAIYIGWRGARVDEAGMRRSLGSLGGYLGQLAAAPTLFDRKPVSERIAPVAISALRSIELELSSFKLGGEPKRHPQTNEVVVKNNKMIVIGHSLGGNLLISGLHDHLVKAIRLHKPYELMPPILGDLVLLINPAAEASKWTALQREIWNRIPYLPDRNISIQAIIEGHKFFATDQRPVLLSVTSSLGFPPGGLQDGDCTAIVARDRQDIMDRIKNRTGEYEQMAGGYDWATHDLFPTFKFDFRPLADYFLRWAEAVEGRPRRGTGCGSYSPSWDLRVLSLPIRAMAAVAATLPFQNTDQESSHTIGHLDPPRVANGLFTEGVGSSFPFGTTHEMRRVGEEHGAYRQNSREQHNAYAAVPNAKISCSRADHWLRRARLDKQAQNGTNWDSTQLGYTIEPPNSEEGPPAVKFHHGFDLGGLIPIARANDPLWNVRVDNSVISNHDGYRLSSFICAINQFVMDEITLPNTPTQAKTPASFIYEGKIPN
jgi:hypothetical protein